jgi:hypothetical protein
MLLAISYLGDSAELSRLLDLHVAGDSRNSELIFSWEKTSGGHINISERR